MSTECIEQNAREKKDWHVCKAANAHQNRQTSKEDTNSVGSDQQNGRNKTRIVRWNDNVQTCQVQLSQGHSVSQDTSQQPVDFKNDASLDTGTSFSSMINDEPLDNAVKTGNSL